MVMYFGQRGEREFYPREAIGREDESSEVEVREDEQDYRQWVGERVEGMTGTLEGEGKALWALNTESLEKLYMALKGESPRRNYSYERKGLDRG